MTEYDIPDSQKRGGGGNGKLLKGETGGAGRRGCSTGLQQNSWRAGQES